MVGWVNIVCESGDLVLILSTTLYSREAEFLVIPVETQALALLQLQTIPIPALF